MTPMGWLGHKASTQTNKDTEIGSVIPKEKKNKKKKKLHFDEVRRKTSYGVIRHVIPATVQSNIIY